MNTAVTLNLAGPAQQSAPAILPAVAEPAPQDAANSAQGFAEQLHASAELPPTAVDALIELAPELPPIESSLVESGQVVDPALLQNGGEAGLEQAEALLGSLLAQHQQLAQAQPAPSQGARAAHAPPGLPSERLMHVDGKAPMLPAEAVVRSETAMATPGTVTRGETAALNTGNEISLPVEMLGTLATAKAVGGETPAGTLAGQASPAPSAVSALPERTLKLQGSDAQRGEQMLHALRDSVDMQIQQKAQRATIRLDPPELGKLEIVVSQEAGRITIQINAGQADTLRLLQQTSDRLRQELLTQHFVQVNVQVGADSQSGQQSRQQQVRYTESAVRDNVLEPSGDDTRRRDASDVLVTV